MCSTAEGIRELAASAKKKYRPDADIAGLFGHSALPPCDCEHERLFGIYLNIDRVYRASSRGVVEGIRVAFNGADEYHLTSFMENDRDIQGYLAHQAKLAAKANRNNGPESATK